MSFKNILYNDLCIERIKKNIFKPLCISKLIKNNYFQNCKYLRTFRKCKYRARWNFKTFFIMTFKKKCIKNKYFKPLCIQELLENVINLFFLIVHIPVLAKITRTSSQLVQK